MLRERETVFSLPRPDKENSLGLPPPPPLNLVAFSAGFPLQMISLFSLKSSSDKSLCCKGHSSDWTIEFQPQERHPVPSAWSQGSYH